MGEYDVGMSKAPICEQCSIQMVERTRKSDGKKFYGCKNWPKCDEAEEHEDADPTDEYGNSCYFYVLIAVVPLLLLVGCNQVRTNFPDGCVFHGGNVVVCPGGSGNVILPSKTPSP